MTEDRAEDPLIDLESFSEIASLMLEETLMDLMGTLFESPEGAVQELLARLKGDDLAATGYSAHKLKGTAMLVGFRAIAKTTGLIESQALKGQKPDASILCEQLLRDSEATQRAMRQFFESKAV